MEQTNEEKKNSWGGRRKGAGRPSVSNSVRSIAIRIPLDVAEILDCQENRTAYIIEAIRTYHHMQQNNPGADSNGGE